MTTQAHIKIINNYQPSEEMLWINHDAFPDIIIPKIKEYLPVDEIKKGYTPTNTILTNLINGFNIENVTGNLFTVHPTLNQIMNYIYTIEIHENTVYLRTQEEYWIEEEENNHIPHGYISSEMRTIAVELI